MAILAVSSSMPSEGVAQPRCCSPERLPTFADGTYHSTLLGCTFHGVSRLHKGHTIGEVVITALSPDEDDPLSGSADEFKGKLVVPFKNENLYAEQTSEQGQTTACI